MIFWKVEPPHLYANHEVSLYNINTNIKSCLYEGIITCPSSSLGKYCHESYFVKGPGCFYKILSSQQEISNICHHCLTRGQSPETSSKHTQGRKCSFRNLNCTFSDVPSVNKCPQALIPAQSHFARDVSEDVCWNHLFPTGIVDESWAQPKRLQLLWVCTQEGWPRLVGGL